MGCRTKSKSYAPGESVLHVVLCGVRGKLHALRVNTRAKSQPDLAATFCSGFSRASGTICVIARLDKEEGEVKIPGLGSLYMYVHVQPRGMHC